jgi:hypothetical protein
MSPAGPVAAIDPIAARKEIIAAANRAIRQHNYLRPPLDHRHMQQAVRICRHRKLVPAAVLTAAGYRAVAR